MLYIEQSLGPEEELVHIGSFHWMYTLNAFMTVIWGVIGSIIVIAGSTFAYVQLGHFPPDIAGK